MYVNKPLLNYSMEQSPELLNKDFLCTVYNLVTLYCRNYYNGLKLIKRQFCQEFLLRNGNTQSRVAHARATS